MGLLASFAPSVAAQEQPAAQIGGQVFIDDEPAPDGTVVEAYIHGDLVTHGEVFGSEIRLLLEQPSWERFEGEVIRFKVDGLETTQLARWFEGTEGWVLLYAYTALAGSDIGFNDFSASEDSFVGDEPSACDRLHTGDLLKGEMTSDAAAITSAIAISLNQFGCILTGELEIESPHLFGSGPFYGTIDGNFLRFTVTSETSDADGDLNFSGLLDGDHIAGQYSVVNTGEVSDWILATSAEGSNFELSDQSRLREMAAIKDLQEWLSALLLERTELEAELEYQTKIDIATVTDHWEQAIVDLKAEVEHAIDLETRRLDLESRQIPVDENRDAALVDLHSELQSITDEKWDVYELEVRLKQEYLNDDITEIQNIKIGKIDRISREIDKVEFEIKSRLEQTGISLAEIRAASADGLLEQFNQPGAVVSSFTDQGGNQSFKVSSSSEPDANRGFFSNSGTGAFGDLEESLDPTTLAVIGILITLAATAVQLVKGN